MAMNGNSLGDEMRVAVDAVMAAAVDKTSAATRQDVWRAIGGAIVAHIQANAVVSATSVVASGIPLQVTTGPGAGSTGNTNATGTATTSTGTIS